MEPEIPLIAIHVGEDFTDYSYAISPDQYKGIYIFTNPLEGIKFFGEIVKVNLE